MQQNQQPFNWPQDQEKDFIEWSRTGELNELKQWVRQQHKSFLLGESYNGAITFLDRPLHSGFHINSGVLKWPAESTVHFFYYLFDRISGIEYVCQLKDTRKNKDGTVDRLYFKPSLYRLLKKPTRNKLYGNITIELSRNHDRITSISLQCDRYAQRGDEFDPFEELMEYLLN